MPLEWWDCFRLCYRSHYKNVLETWVSGGLASILFFLWDYILLCQDGSGVFPGSTEVKGGVAVSEKGR